MKSTGQIAYEAYSDKAHGESLVTGAKLPPWLKLSAGIIDAWQAAADAVTEAGQ
jgi:hypothetical protein